MTLTYILFILKLCIDQQNELLLKIRARSIKRTPVYSSVFDAFFFLPPLRTLIPFLQHTHTLTHTYDDTRD